ncbi:MAG: DUF4395 domain-containing protein [Paludibacteraceae bacterium]
MKTAICPISDKRINENVARGNAFLTVGFIIAYLLTVNPFFIIFLLLDFFLRSVELSKYSPLAFLSGKINYLLNLHPKIINAGPKIFAARIGVVFSSLILISFLAGWQTTALILSVAFGICAFLEAVFAFCIACEIYPFVYRLFYKS